MTTSMFPSAAEQKEYWDNRWDRSRLPNAWQQERSERVLKYIRSLQLKRPRILDLGCATGWFTERLSHIGNSVGIDLSPHAIDLAKKTHPNIRYLAGDFYEISSNLGQFDLVVNQEVIPHVPDQPQFIQRIGHILKPGGYLVITAANKFIMDRVDFGPDPDSHIKKWLSMGELKRLLAPHFRTIRSTSAIFIGNRGVLGVANSHKLNGLLRRLFSDRAVQACKGKLGFGYTLLVLAQKR